jgi:hypothetical protein
MRHRQKLPPRKWHPRRQKILEMNQYLMTLDQKTQQPVLAIQYRR